MSAELGKYRPFVVFEKAEPRTPRWFIGKQSNCFGLTRWGGVIYAFGRQIALGVEHNDGPFWRVDRI